MAQSSTTFEHISVDNQGTSSHNVTTAIGNNITITSKQPEGRFVWNVRDSIVTFKGREEIIRKLHLRIVGNQLNQNRNVASQTIAICGMGGLGKTEMIRKYIQIYHSEYTNIVWINAEKYSEAKTDFLNLGKRLNINTTLNKGTAEEDRYLANDIYTILAKNRTLIVFDNVQLLSNDAIKSSFFPVTTSVTKPLDIILTTREKLNDYHTIDLDGLSIEESYDLFVSSLAICKTEENYKATSEIYKLCEGLPIVLQQVVGMIKKENKDQMRAANKYSLTEYATNVHANLHSLTIARPADSLLGDSVFSIFQISFQRMITLEHGKLALHCLDIMSLLNPDNIPTTLLEHIVNKNDFTRAMLLLIEYNLVTMDEHEGMFRVHRVIQVIRRHSTNFLKTKDSSFKLFLVCIPRRPILSAEINAFKQFLNKIELSDRNNFHVLHNGIRLHETFHMHNRIEFFGQGAFLDALANKLRIVGRYEEAKQMFQVLLQNRTKQLGESHPDTLATQHHLALVYKDQGKYEQAEEMLQFVLQKETKGESHPDTLTAKHNLALVYTNQGKYEQAEKLNQFVLQERTKVLGESYPDTLITKHNLALVYTNQSKYEQAEEMFQFVLQEETKVLGESHPSTLTTKNNLALVYNRRGKYEQAEELYHYVLLERTTLLGENYPDTLITKNNLALLHKDQAKYEQAEEMFQFVLQQQTKVLGGSHPYTLNTKNNLAAVYKDQGKREQAEEMFQFVLVERMRVLGENHPHTLTTKKNLASLC